MPCLPPVSRHRCTTSVFYHFISGKPPHPTSLPVHRSQSFTRAQSSSPTRRTGTFTAVELRRSVVCPPRFDSVPGTMSGRCAEVHGFLLRTSSRGSSSLRPSLAGPRYMLALHAVRRVDLNVVCPRPSLRATLCQAAPHRSGHLLCAAWPSSSRW
jgi:hypothetical protein